VTYFTAEARSAYEQAGLRGFWRGYFAGRAAPLGVAGAAGAAVVAASFFNFAPAFVARAIPGVWELITPEEALRVRLAGAAEGLGRLLAGQEAEAAAAGDLLWRAIGELDFSGRVLAAANAALPVPPGSDAAASGSSALGLRGFCRFAAGLGFCGRGPNVLRGTGATAFRRAGAADIDGCEAGSCAAASTCAGGHATGSATDEATRPVLAGARGGPMRGALTSGGAGSARGGQDATDWAASRPGPGSARRPPGGRAVLTRSRERARRALYPVRSACPLPAEGTASGSTGPVTSHGGLARHRPAG
jgi:hypothetical protein